MRTAKVPRILVVEDQALLAEIITEALAGSHEVLWAYSVADAVELLLGAAIDLVLLDCVLPGGTMWQVVLEADRQNIPLVLMTGDPIQLKEVAGGSRPFLLKPFSFAALLEVVERTIGTGVDATFGTL
jgi:two-component system, OmpR family, response regulator